MENFTPVKEIAATIFKLSDAVPITEDKFDNLLSTRRLSEFDEKVVISKIEGEIRHTNYLRYLELCWGRHFSIVLKPDYLWQIILCELAIHIKENAEKYRHLFSESDTKQEITVLSNDVHVLPLDEIVEKLKSYIPIDIEAFIPKFSTTTPMSALAFNAAFCDAVSPYYSYAMLACNFPKIRVDGTLDDWKKMSHNISILKNHFELSTYFNNVSSTIDNIVKALLQNDATFFQTLFKLKRCGSGHQQAVDGWIKNFFIKTAALGFISNYPSCISVINYKSISINKEFMMKVGLFSSKFEDEFLTPEFGYSVHDK